MAYSNTVKFIILGILLIIIAFAVGMVWNVNRSNASQRHLQECTDYQQAMVDGNASTNPGCSSK
jgi:hypothetical protein